MLTTSAPPYTPSLPSNASSGSRSTLLHADQVDVVLLGYVRGVQRLLHSSPTLVISKEVVSLILAYLRILYHGSFRWEIPFSSLLQMLTARSEQRFISAPFSIGGIIWQISAFPNGFTQRDMGSFKLFIGPISMPPEWHRVVASVRFLCPETLSGDASMYSFTNGRSHKIYKSNHGQLLLDDIRSRNLKQLTFELQIEILSLHDAAERVLYQHALSVSPPHLFEWNITGALLQEMQYSYLRKCFVSPVFHKMWVLKLYPSGHSGTKTVRVEIQCVALPPNCRWLAVQWRLSIADWVNGLVHRHRFCPEASSADCGSNLLTFKGFKSCDSFSVKLRVEFLAADSIGNGPSMHSVQQQLAEKRQQQQQQQHVLLQQQQQQRQFAVGMEAVNRVAVMVQALDHKVASSVQHLSATVSAVEAQGSLATKVLRTNFAADLGRMGEQIQAVAQRLMALTQRVEAKEKEMVRMKEEIGRFQARPFGNGNEEGEAIRLWLRDQVKLPQYFHVLVENGFDDMESIGDLEDAVLKEIGVEKVGHRRKIIKYKEKAMELSTTSSTLLLSPVMHSRSSHNDFVV